MAKEKDESKKSAGEIVIEQFLKDVEESDEIPWMQPYNMYSAFNWYTKTQYRGFNRLILPFGEYITYNQMVEYNKKTKSNYRYDKENGRWYYVIFFKRDEQNVDSDWAINNLPQDAIDALNSPSGGRYRYKGWLYFSDKDGNIKRVRNILKYSRVAERKCWIDPDTGKCPPSRIETGEVEIERFDAKAVFDAYVDREGIRVDETTEIPCFIPAFDMVQLNKHSTNEEFWWATAFHELAHSTMMPSRLNREFYRYVIKNQDRPEGYNEKDIRAKEECIAEIAASMVCSECNIAEFKTSESMQYQNHIAYVQSWKKRIKDWGTSFIYIVSEAEKAYLYILGEKDE